MDLWQPAYIGVGSNLDDPRAQLLRAFDQLAAIPATRCILVSPLYASIPMGPVAQPDFVNAVAALLTQLTPRELLTHLRAIERQAGRPEQHEKWGPRVLDLDLLVFGRQVLREPDLTVPHPGVVERNFVLYPLADIAPDLDVPGLGRAAGLRDRVAPTGLQAL